MLDRLRKAGLVHQTRDGLVFSGQNSAAHPTDGVHDCSIDLPLPNDLGAQREVEGEIAMRLRWTQAA